MSLAKRILLSVNVASVICYSTMGYSNVTNVPNPTYNTQSFFTMPSNKTNFYADLLYIQPSSDNLKYATFVAGNQPYSQSWHYLEITPSYHPAVELGLNYAIKDTLYSAGISWMFLNSNDSSSKQAATSIDTATIEFVGPPYEMSPPVFGIKSVNSTVNFDYNNVLLNIGKVLDNNSRLQTKFFGGLDIFSLNQTITTTFGDYAGALPTAYSYALPPDPSFSFQTENVSKYLGVGPALGMNLEYVWDSGWGLMGEILGVLTAGTSQTQDNFTSTSARLTSNGIGTSHQQITSPNDTQIVFGGDAKLGVLYKYRGIRIPNLTFELGYRIATYLNAISTISPNTLVQPGTVETTPEFSTGTMAIVSTRSQTGPFSFNGAFLKLKVELA